MNLSSYKNTKAEEQKINPAQKAEEKGEAANCQRDKSKIQLWMWARLLEARALNSPSGDFETKSLSYAPGASEERLLEESRPLDEVRRGQNGSSAISLSGDLGMGKMCACGSACMSVPVCAYRCEVHEASVDGWNGLNRAEQVRCVLDQYFHDSRVYMNAVVKLLGSTLRPHQSGA
ncbi:unnamed protein product [Protopolystoma xenopodis]|uniref:Uncharacterized protein n=1 Tax=Protopolystoma xenopodis TaxID=117903 RepID=A0A3S5FDA5_9PLAT|nr:unnamed protein product [Protopolystoma xenopodis]